MAYIIRLTGPDGISEHLNYDRGWGPANQGESLYETASGLFKLSTANFEMRCEDGTVINNDLSFIPCSTEVATIVGTTQLGRKTLREHAQSVLIQRSRADASKERSLEMEEISKLYERSTVSLPLTLYDGKVTVYIKLSRAGLYNNVMYFFERYNLIPDLDFKLQCKSGHILDPNEGIPADCKELTFLAGTTYGQKVEKIFSKGYLKARENVPTPRRRGASAAGPAASMSSAESERMIARKKAIREMLEEQKLADSLLALSMGGRNGRRTRWT
jgi:hypothetical protein